MQTVEEWTDPSYPSEAEQRFIEGQPYGTLRMHGDSLHATNYFGLRTVRRKAETSQMALINAFGSPAWIHIGNLQIVAA